MLQKGPQQKEENLSGQVQPPSNVAITIALALILRRIHNPLWGWYFIYVSYLVYAWWWGYRVWRLNRGSSPVR